MKSPVADEPAEPSEETVGESDEPSRSSFVVLVVVGAVIAWRIVAGFPEVAYVVVGILGTLGWQKGRAWLSGRREEESDSAETEQPDIGTALRRLVGDDKGVLLTRLRDDLQLPDTKAVKQLLNEAGVRWRAGVRTGAGNGPAVHQDDIPPAPSPADDCHGDRCCCRSDANTNTNSAEPPSREARSRVRRIRSAKALYDPNDNIRRHTSDGRTP